MRRAPLVRRQAKIIADSFTELDAVKRARLCEIFEAFADDAQVRGVYCGLITAALIWAAYKLLGGS